MHQETVPALRQVVCIWRYRGAEFGPILGAEAGRKHLYRLTTHLYPLQQGYLIFIYMPVPIEAGIDANASGDPHDPTL
jgi:hypothetical protein